MQDSFYNSLDFCGCRVFIFLLYSTGMLWDDGGHVIVQIKKSLQNFEGIFGGEKGIRTLGTV